MRRLAGFALLAALADPGRMAAQEPGPAWAFGATAYYYADADPDFLLPIATADRGPLHLEARWNYEDQKTLSAWLGWTFETGEALTLSVTPMVGGVVGRTDGLAPGVELSLAWRAFELYVEDEYVVTFGSGNEDYFYNWSELSWHAPFGLRAGVSTQRLKSRNSDLALDRGPMLGWTFGDLSLSGYAYNPFSDDAFLVLGASLVF